MDLTSDIIFLRINKKFKLKNLKSENILPVIALRKRFSHMEEKDDKNEEKELEKCFEGIIYNESDITNFIFNSTKPKIINCFNNLQYLSLANNFLNNLNFLLKFPDLLYLDVNGNPLEDFDALNYKNIFLYLRLSAEKYNENKILNIMGLNCGIFEMEIKDKNVLRLFKHNNKHICLFNNEVNYYVDKIKNEERRIAAKARRNKRRQSTESSNADPIIKNAIKNLNLNNKEDNSGQNESFICTERSSEDNNLGFNSFLPKPKVQLSSKLISENFKKIIQVKNESLIEIKNHFEELYNYKDKVKKKFLGCITSEDLINDDKYLDIEKKKLLIIYKVYKKIEQFNDKISSGKFYCNNNFIIGNFFTKNVKLYEFKQYIKVMGVNIRFALIVLTTILFFTLNIISLKLTITIIHYILKKYYKYDEHKQLPDIKIFNKMHLLCFYFDYLEDFKSKIKYADKTQNELYSKIIEILKMQKLIILSNVLQKKLEKNNENIKKNDSVDDNCKKNKVSNLLLFIKDIDLNYEIFLLIEFFCDFIIYEDIEQLVINGSDSEEYSTLIILKEILEQIEFDKNNLSVKDLSNRKYYQDSLERIFNKFYFENDRIKVIKNKQFPKIIRNRYSSLQNNRIACSAKKINLSDYNENDKNENKNQPRVISLDKINNYSNNIKEIEKNKEDSLKNIFKNSNDYLLSNNTIHAKMNDRKFSLKGPIVAKSFCNYYTEENDNSNSNNNKKSFDLINESYGWKSKIYSPDNKSKLNVKNIFLSNQYLSKELSLEKSSIKNKRLVKNLKRNFFDKNSSITYNDDKVVPLYGSSKKEMKLKIQQFDQENTSINAHRIYAKKNISKINVFKKNKLLGDELSVKKYNKNDLCKILMKIIAEKNLKYNVNKKK